LKKEGKILERKEQIVKDRKKQTEWKPKYGRR
jgi:hypothetical protein